MKVAPRAPGAGLRKPPREETAGGVTKLRVRRYGDLDAGGLLPRSVDNLFGKQSMGWRARSADRNRQNRHCAAWIDRRGGCPWRRDGEHGQADPKHLGARVGITSVLHTWGSAMTHHPHVHDGA